MAGDVIGSALVDLRANTGGFLSDIAGAVSKAEGSFSGMKGNISGSVSGIGSILTAGVTAPIIGIGLFSVASAEKLDNSFAQMGRATGAQGEQLEMLKKSWKDVYGNTPTDATTVTGVITKLTQTLHLQGQELTDVSRKIIEYSTATGTDATTNTESFAKAMIAWNVPASEQSHKIDELTIISQKYGVTMGDLNPLMEKTAASSQRAGLSFEQQATLLTQLTAAGVPAKSVVSEFNKITEQAAKDGKSAADEWKGLVQRLKEGTESANDIKLLGAQYANFSKLAKEGKLDNDAFAQSLVNSGNATDEAAKKNETLGQKLTELKNKLEIAFEPLGKVIIQIFINIIDVIQPVLPIITAIAEAFSHLPAPIQMIVVLIGGILAALGPILMILPSLAAGFEILSTILGFISLEAITAFAPFIIAAVIIAAIAVGLYLLYTRFKPFHDAVDQVVGWVKTLLGDLMSGNFGKLGEDFKKGIRAGLGALLHFDWGGMWQTIINTSKALWGGIITFLKNIDWGGLWRYIVSMSVQFWSPIITFIKNIDWGGVWKFIVDTSTQFWSAIIGFIEQIDWGGVWNFIVQTSSSFWGAIIGFIEQIDWGGLWNFIVQTSSSFWGQIGQDILNAVRGVAGDIGNAVMGAFTGLSIPLSIHIGPINYDGALALAEGAYVKARPGGVSVVVGEGSEDEIVAPLSKLGSLASLPQMANGGVISGGNISSLSSAIISGAASSGGDTYFQISIENAQLTSMHDAEALGRAIGYKADEILRRSGHARG